MSSYRVVDDPDSVDYTTMVCWKTTDGIFYEIPKEYFRGKSSSVRKSLNLTEPFSTPLDNATFQPFVVLLEKSAILSVKVEDDGKTETENAWMRALDKRQLKFVRQFLNISTWGGKSVPFYEEKHPKIKDVVWVKIVQVNDTSAVVQLQEYGLCDGTIPYTEVTRRRVRSIGKFIKVGKCEAAQVIRLDEVKGYIDLSKKQVTPAEAKACEARFRKGNDVRSIVCHVADACGIEPLEAMKMIAYPLYRRQPGKHAFDWLKELHDTKDVDGILGPLNIPKRVVDCLMENLQRTLRLRVLTLAAQLDISCTSPDGVTQIRDVLLLGRNFGKGQELDISVIIIGPPLYDLRIRTDLREDGLAFLTAAISAMTIEMAKRGGILKVTKEPYVMGEDGSKEKEVDEVSEDEEEDTEEKGQDS